MSIKKYRPYLTEAQIKIILNRLDTSYKDEKELHGMLSVHLFKIESEMIAPVTETQTIEEKLGFFPKLENPESAEAEANRIQQSIIQSQST